MGVSNMDKIVHTMEATKRDFVDNAVASWVCLYVTEFH
jgi:hypothetical protein